MSDFTASSSSLTENPPPEYTECAHPPPQPPSSTAGAANTSITRRPGAPAVEPTPPSPRPGSSTSNADDDDDEEDVNDEEIGTQSPSNNNNDSTPATAGDIPSLLLSIRRDLERARSEKDRLRDEVARKDLQIRALAGELARREEEVRSLEEGLKTRTEELKNVPTYKLKKRDAGREENERLSSARHKRTLGKDYLRWSVLATVFGILLIVAYRHQSPQESYLGPVISLFVLVVGLVLAGWKEVREAQALEDAARVIGDYMQGLESSVDDLFRSMKSKRGGAVRSTSVGRKEASVKKKEAEGEEKEEKEVQERGETKEEGRLEEWERILEKAARAGEQRTGAKQQGRSKKRNVEESMLRRDRIAIA